MELTLIMPSEITLAENMRVRCRGKVVRVCSPQAGSKCAVAVQLEGYEFLPEAPPAPAERYAADDSQPEDAAHSMPRMSF